jgi:hypothetical protein
MANLYRRCSPRPGEGGGVPALPNVGELQPERADPRGGRLGHSKRRVRRMEHASYLGNLALWGLRRHDVEYLDLREVSYAHPVAARL